MYERHYTITARFDGTMDEAEERVREVLAAEGFGVVTRLDMQETLRAKLGVERRPYRIFGACNPPLAHRGLEAELPLGALLPCNVSVFEGEDDAIYVQAINPDALFEMLDREENVSKDVHAVASEISGRLRRAIAAL